MPRKNSSSTASKARTSKPKTTEHITLPIFSVTNPRIWLMQVELAFDCHNITCQRTKFLNVVAQLPTDIASEVADLINPIPETDPFDVLKLAIIKRTAVSDEANLRQLLAGVEIGDRTPSQLLRHMQGLVNGKALDESVIRQLWLKSLPPTARQILVTQTETPLGALAEAADKIHECLSERMVAAVAHPASQSEEIASLNARLEQMQLKIDKLAEVILNSNSAQNASFNNRRTFSRQTSSSSGKNNGICFYHNKFKDDAKRCILPCAYVSNTSGNLPASQ